MARRRQDVNQTTPVYDSNEEATLFTLKIINGGIMKNEPVKNYVGNKKDYFDRVDVEMFGLIELKDFIEQLGYNSERVRFWHKFGRSLYVGSCVIETDMDAYEIVKWLSHSREIEIYVEHLDNSSSNSQIHIESTLPDQSTYSALDNDIDPVIDFSFLDNVTNTDPSNDNHDESYSDSSDCDAFFDSDYDMDDDDDIDFDKYVDPSVEFGGLSGSGKELETQTVAVTTEMIVRIEGDEEDLDENSDSFESCDDSDEGKGVKFPKYNPKTESKNPDLKLGMTFSTKKEAKTAIESHCLRRGMAFKFVLNDNRRLRAKCKKEGCEWFVYVSPMNEDKQWQLKGYNSNHKNCSWNYKNPSLRSGWMGRSFKNKLKDNPKLGTSEFRNKLCSSLKADVSKQQAYRAKQKALELVHGSVKEQFSRIRDYCTELLRSNPESTVVLKLSECDSNTGQPTFLRLYIYFDACKKGFKFCRKVVGVDGCFLKGPQGGQLLSAVGIDPNNQMFPIAFAVVENENRDSWVWFLSLLETDLGVENQFEWKFMSDKQKGLIDAFDRLFPDAENRFCIRHLHSNMKRDGFTGQSIKDALWVAARATRVEEFNSKMQNLKELDESTFNWLVNKPPNQWSRSHFSPIPKCDIILNNMCESFNSFILVARDKPIITMLENIRNLLMTRLQVSRIKARKWDGSICPRIIKLYEKNVQGAKECIPMQCDDWNWQITGPFDQHNVNLSKRICSCRRWDLTGIPCKHAINAIWCKNEDPQTYIDTSYNVATYFKVYDHAIMGVNGPELWPNVDLPEPLPPKYENKPGRPKKMRKRQADDPPLGTSATKLRKHQRTVKCKKCGESGNNSRTCKNKNKQPFEADPQPARIPTLEGSNQPQGKSQPSMSSHPPMSSQPSRNPSQRSSKTPKQPIMKKRGSSSGGVNISGHSNKVASINIGKTSTVNFPVIVRGGVNYITMANLKASFGEASASKGKEPKK